MPRLLKRLLHFGIESVEVLWAHEREPICEFRARKSAEKVRWHTFLYSRSR